MASYIDIEIPVLHPSLARIAEMSYRTVANFDPQSIPDLHYYLASQSAAMKANSEVYMQFGDRMAATFPGITLVHPFFAQVAHGYAGLQGPAYEAFTAWKQLQAADLARFTSPRVNEIFADVARHGVSLENVPVLDDGITKWHGNHTAMIEVTRSSLFGLEWGSVDEDKVAELLTWLTDLPLFFDCLGRHTRNFGARLVNELPVEPRIYDFYHHLAAGYLGVADQAEELLLAYRQRNAHDVDRRENPRPREAWADFGNRAMTGS